VGVLGAIWDVVRRKRDSWAMRDKNANLSEIEETGN